MNIPVTFLAQAIASGKLKPTFDRAASWKPAYRNGVFEPLPWIYFVDDVTAQSVANILDGKLIKLTPENLWLDGQPNTANGTDVSLANYIRFADNSIVCVGDIFAPFAFGGGANIWGLTTEQAIEQMLTYSIPQAVVSVQTAFAQSMSYPAQQALMMSQPWGPPEPVFYNK